MIFENYNEENIGKYLLHKWLEKLKGWWMIEERSERKMFKKTLNIQKIILKNKCRQYL